MKTEAPVGSSQMGANHEEDAQAQARPSAASTLRLPFLSAQARGPQLALDWTAKPVPWFLAGHRRPDMDGVHRKPGS